MEQLTSKKLASTIEISSIISRLHFRQVWAAAEREAISIERLRL